MRRNAMLVSAGVLILAFGAGALSAEAGQRDSKGRDRNGRASHGQIQGSSGSQPDARRDQPQAERPQGSLSPGAGTSDNRGQVENRTERREVAPARRNYQGGYYDARPSDRRRDERRDAHRYDGHGRDDYYRHGAPRPVPGYPPPPRHYYGPGGNFSVYFGWGSGYLYGSFYDGRVYGAVAPRAYGAPVYYGDVRVQAQPRNAAVYVDGYYAGVVDNFDGTFQRLTIEAGRHQIELNSPGLPPQFFDVYVDPARTTTIRADLFR